MIKNTLFNKLIPWVGMTATLLVLGMAFLPAKAQAEPTPTSSPGPFVDPATGTTFSPTTSPAAEPPTPTTDFTFGTQNLSAYMGALYSWSIGVAAGLAIIMLIFAGYKMVTSAGNPQAVGEAKEIIIGSLSGLALLFAAVLVLKALSVL